MKRVLIVKVTSLGDVVQAQPVAEDLRRAFPGIKVDWAVDELYADIVQWNEGVDRVLYAPLRRFKKTRRWQDFKAIVASIGELRAVRYDAVIDIHGVYKSAIIAFLARSSRRLGYVTGALGERGAAFAYTERFQRPDCDAWHGMRVSVADALGYELAGPPVYNLRVPGVVPPSPGAAPVAMFFHAASGDVKKWPISHWATVARALTARGVSVILPWGSPQERNEAALIAAEAPGATVAPRMSVLEMAQTIETATLIVGVDTGLTHLAHALGKPTVMIFAATSPKHCGVHVSGRSISLGEIGAPPTVSDVLQAIHEVYPDAHATQAA